MTDFGRDLESWRSRNEKHLDTIGDAAGKAGLGITAGLALAGKAAIDWESAWAGVTKTVDGSASQMADLEGELRGLAKTLPATHAEIAGVAEAAGQLGVAREDVAAFTRTMIDLSETTNLSADEAATSMAQFMNVMGTSGDKVDELGSSLVALGNDGASTEKDIMSMATRLSGAGKLVGASEADVLALANAMSSVGIEAELGGGVMTRVMTRMYSDVQTGGEGLENLARVAGVSSADFAEAFKNDPVRAIDMMVKGLEGVKLSGGNVVETMKDLGIKGTEEVGTLLRLAGAGDLLSESLDLGASSWEENSALAEEARKRYETTEAKVTIAWNNIKDAAITAGSVMLPIIAQLAEGAAGLAEWFGAIPKPIQTFLTVLAGVSGAGLLAVGGMITLSKKAAELSEAFTGLYGTGGRAQRGITMVSKALSGAMIVGAALLAGKSIIEGINEAARAGKPDLEEYFNLLTTGGGKDVVQALDFGQDRGAGINKALEQYKEKIGAISIEAAVAKRALDQVGDVNWFENNMLSAAPGGAGQAIEDALQLEEAMKSVARAFDMGELDVAQQGFADMTTQLGFTDAEVGKLINGVPELKKALLGVATEGGLKIDPNNELALVDLALGRIEVSAPNAAGAIEGVSPPLEDAAAAAETAAKEVDDFYDALVNIGAIAISERDALRGLEESFDAAAEAATKNGKTLDDSTEKGRANGASLDDIATKTLGAVTAQQEYGRSQTELAGTMEQGRKAFVKQAQDMGMSKTAANALADELNLIPEAVFMDFDSNAEAIAWQVTDLHEKIRATPDKKITISDTSPAVKAALEALGYVITELPDGKIEVSESGTDEAGNKIDAAAKKKRDAKINATAITKAAEAALDAVARNRKVFVTAVAATGSSINSMVNSVFGGKARGGRAPGLASGGRVPHTGLGTDKVMGVNADGVPHVRVDDREWVINRQSSDEYDRELAMINAGTFPKLGLAGGGRPGNPPTLSVPPSREVVRHAAQAASTTITIPITINGATDGARVAQAVEDKLTSKLARVGVRIG